MFDYFISGWSFFFRWPIANAKTFRPLGIFLGPILQASVFLFFSLVGFFLLSEGQRHWAPAFGFVGLSMLTGFFHEDGLADTADSLGVSKFDSHTSLEKIHFTFKDPRLGTFGVSALVMLWSFRVLVVSQAQLSLTLWFLVCMLSRSASLGLGLLFSSWFPLARSARSSHVMQSVRSLHASILLLAVSFVGILIGFQMERASLFRSSHFALNAFDAGVDSLAASLVVMLLASLFVFRALVRRTEALNGDLLGALVCISEVFLTICILKIF